MYITGSLVYGIEGEKAGIHRTCDSFKLTNNEPGKAYTILENCPNTLPCIMLGTETQEYVLSLLQFPQKGRIYKAYYVCSKIPLFMREFIGPINRHTHLTFTVAFLIYQPLM